MKFWFMRNDDFNACDEFVNFTAGLARLLVIYAAILYNILCIFINIAAVSSVISSAKTDETAGGFSVSCKSRQGQYKESFSLL